MTGLQRVSVYTLQKKALLTLLAHSKHARSSLAAVLLPVHASRVERQTLKEVTGLVSCWEPSTGRFPATENALESSAGLAALPGVLWRAEQIGRTVIPTACEPEQVSR